MVNSNFGCQPPALLIFNHSQTDGKRVFTVPFFQTTSSLLVAIDVPAIDAFFHSSVIFMLQ
jgi:hypothetical protein